MLDFLNERMRQERASQQTFVNVDEALRAYSELTGKNITPLPPEPRLSDFYEPSEDQKTRELVWILGGTAIVGLLAYRYSLRS